jgi:putative ABC transport system permease protein
MADMSFAERVYRLLLRCYPGEFRDDYEREMLALFRDRLSDDRRAGMGAVLGLWWQLIADSLTRAPREHLDVLRQDLRYASRSLRRSRAFTITAILTLALGVGANTAIFSVVHAVALRPLPYDPNDRLVRIWETQTALDIDGFAVSLPNYVSWRERSQTMELAAWMVSSVTLPTAGDPARVEGRQTSFNYFDILGAKALHGRVFEATDDVIGAAGVAVITDAVWRQLFDGRTDTFGRAINIAGMPHTIVGIVPKEALPTQAGIFTPLRINLKEQARDNHICQVMGRLRPGVARQQALAELAGIARQLEVEFPASNRGWGVTIESMYDAVVPQETRSALYVLLAASGCVLLIACANVANLMLARAAGQRREMAMRLAIGAARRRLVRQTLTEGIVLTALGGVAGILIAWWTVPLARPWLPDSLPRAQDTSVNLAVLLFSLGVCAITAITFGLLPAIVGSRSNLIDSLKDASRGSTGAGVRMRQALAAAQIAVATILLIGAGLLTQSLIRLQQVPLGFDPSSVTMGTLALPQDRYKDSTAAWMFYERLLGRVSAMPGVRSAAITSGAPFSGGNTGMPIEAVGPSRLNGQPLQADWRMVSPGYFDAFRIPLLRGRTFAGNRSEDDQMMIISSGMARRIWGDDENPLGKHLKAGPNGEFTVIGIVDDVRNLELSVAPAPTMYLSTARYFWSPMNVVVRGAGEQPPGAEVVRSAVREIDPQLALYDVRSTRESIDRSAAQPRLNTILIGLFAGLAAVLAAVGIYGVLAYVIAQRTQEIGIRMALGADARAVVRHFLAGGARLMLAGMAAGLAGALLVTRWAESLLYEVQPRDPWSFGAGLAIVAAITAIACLIPSRRATRVDPLTALRAE